MSHAGVPFPVLSIVAINRQPKDDYGIGKRVRTDKAWNEIVRRISFEFRSCVSQQKNLVCRPDFVRNINHRCVQNRDIRGNTGRTGRRFPILLRFPNILTRNPRHWRCALLYNTHEGRFSPTQTPIFGGFRKIPAKDAGCLTNSKQDLLGTH